MNISDFPGHSQLYFNLSYCSQLELRPIESAILSLLSNLDYGKFETDNEIPGRPNAVDARTMMVIIIYARTEGKYSCRDIASLCTRDVFLLSVLEGRKAPSFVTINRFIKNNADAIEDISVQAVRRLDSYGELSKDIVFQDGTKIESRAGKYSFVWKSGVEKNQTKLRNKAIDIIEDIEDGFSFGVTCDERDCIEDKLRILVAKFKTLGVALVPEVTGKGHRLAPAQRYFALVENMLSKLAEYKSSLHLIGNGRKSMSKTDTDATFMRMKEDHMGNGQLKPAYNIQTLVDGNYIVGSYSSSDRTDYNTMVPALAKIRGSYDWKYNGFCADSGYDSLSNHAALDNLGIEDYIKPQNYEIAKTRKYKNDIGRKDNMAYDERTDAYTCAAGKKLRFIKTRYGRSQHGDRTEVKTYRCGRGCKSCKMRGRCMGKSKRTYKQFETNFRLDAYRKKAFENLASDFGTEVRVNRSVQSEGVFAQIKANWSFRRFLSFGKRRSLSEWILMTMAMNAIHLANRMERNQVGSPFWYSIPPDEPLQAV